jgi:hypothetical protein
MKRITIFIALALAIGFTGCYRDIITPELAKDPDGPPQAVSYKNELAPMFNSNCALSGCHVTGGHKPYLTTDVSYQQLVNGGYVNTSIPKESILYKMVNGEMAQYLPSPDYKQKIYDWIRNGAPNN